MSIVREYEESDGTYNIFLDAGSYTTSMVRCEFQAPAGTTIYLSYAECMTFRDENGKISKGMRMQLTELLRGLHMIPLSQTESARRLEHSGTARSGSSA